MPLLLLLCYLLECLGSFCWNRWLAGKMLGMGVFSLFRLVSAFLCAFFYFSLFTFYFTRVINWVTNKVVSVGYSIVAYVGVRRCTIAINMGRERKLFFSAEVDKLGEKGQSGCCWFAYLLSVSALVDEIMYFVRLKRFNDKNARGYGEK